MDERNWMPAPAISQARDMASEIFYHYRNLAVRLGEMKSLSAIKKMDRIEVISGKDGEIELITDEEMDVLKQMPAICSMPFLETGVIKLVPEADARDGRKIFPAWICFHLEKVDMEKGTFSVRYETYVNITNRDYLYAKDMSWVTDVTALGVMEEKCTMHNREQEGPLDFLRRMKETEPDAPELDRKEWHILEGVFKKNENEEYRKGLAEEYHKCASAIFSQMSFLMAKEESKPAEAKPREPKGTPKKQGRKPKAEPPKPKVVLIGNSRVTLQPGTTAKIKGAKRIQNRYTQSWSVRGHIRHYRNGKLRWIQPYQKGPGRSIGADARQKIYKKKD